MTSRYDWKIGSSSIAAGVISAEVFEDYARNGVECIELSRLNEIPYFDDYKTIKKQAENAGVSLHSLHVPFSVNFTVSQLEPEEHACTMASIKKYIDCAAESEVKTVVIHPSSGIICDDVRAAKLERSLESLAELTILCKDRGMKLCVENLPRTGLVNCPDEALLYLNTLPDIFFCFDTNHMLRQTNREFLDILIENGMKGRIAAVHISDYDFVDERHLLPTGGINDWKMILSKLEELDYDGAFMYEVRSAYEGPGAAKPSAKTEDMLIHSLGDIKLNHDMLMKL